MIRLNPQEWTSRYERYLLTYAKKRVRNDQLAEDLVQETYLAGLKSLNKFRGKSSERTWLTSILRHKIIDEYRRKKSFQGWLYGIRVPNPDFEEFCRINNVKAIESFLKADNLTMLNELHEILNYLKPRLTEREKLIYELKVEKDYTSEEICKHINMSRESYWVACHRMRKKLKFNLKEIFDSLDH